MCMYLGIQKPGCCNLETPMLIHDDTKYKNYQVDPQVCFAVSPTGDVYFIKHINQFKPVSNIMCGIRFLDEVKDL